MSERPILFSGPMVRAILAGRKTQTRRVVRDQSVPGRTLTGYGNGYEPRTCPYGKPGDTLWVKETFAVVDDGSALRFRASEPGLQRTWKPSIFMPRSCSRLTLRVTAVRVERLQDITEADAKAEGVTNGVAITYRDHFCQLWDAINGKRASWASNPFVWVVSFEVAP